MKSFIEVTRAREMIKPSSPTPDRTNYALSWFDRISSRNYTPVVLFYRRSSAFSNNTTTSSVDKNYSSLLQKSLSQSLTHYYPFAGRLEANGESILCNDEGVIFLEANLKYSLSAILENPKAEILNTLFPKNLQWKYLDDKSGALMAIQANYLECGGFALGVCMSHKIGDTATLTTFLNYWANMASGQDQEKMTPELLCKIASSFPVDDHPLIPEPGPNRSVLKWVSRRFVFDASKIAQLKAMVANDKVPNPSKVEVVTALLYKCAVSAAAANLRNNPRPSILYQNMNLRPRMVPKLAENSVGNLIWVVPVAAEGSKGIELSGLVEKLKEAKAHLCNSIATMLNHEEVYAVIEEKKVEIRKLIESLRKAPDVYWGSSWCRFPLYEVDFGFGKPIWVTVPSCFRSNGFLLMDTNTGDGIEAIVGLKEKDMAVFEADEELLKFATCNPSVLDCSSSS